MLRYVLLLFVCLTTVPWRCQATKDLPCHPRLSLALPDAVLLNNGNVVAGGRQYPVGTYWKNGTGYYGCPCSITNCIRKCPKEFDSGGIIQESNQNAESVWIIKVWENNEEKSVNAYEHFEVFVGDTCEPGMASDDLDPDLPQDKFKILSNGSMHYYNTNRIEGPDHFCLFQKDANTTVDEDASTHVAYCLEPMPDGHGAPPKPFHHTLYPVFLFTSVFFLCLTLITYILRPESNLHSRCMIVHCVCLTFGFLGLAIVQTVGQHIRIGICYVIGFITYYFLLSSFYWLNVMCFDIWFTFSDFKKMTRILSQSNQKKFVVYFLYATISPTILFIITFSVQMTTTNKNKMYSMSPGFGEISCWFQNNLAELLYFNGPISILLILNCFFFISTTVKILNLKKETAVLKSGENRTHNNEDKLRFKIYLKLFLVMGLSWTFEIISWIGKMLGAPDEAWYLTDSINTLQGVFIFILCVWFTKSRNDLLQFLLPRRWADRFSFKVSHTYTPSAATKSSDTTETNQQPNSYSMKSLNSKKNLHN